MSFDQSQQSAVAEELVAAIRGFYANGWCPASSSNFSFRSLNGTASVSRTGVDKAVICSKDFLTVPIAAAAETIGELGSSAETLLHMGIYQRYQWVGCVMHTHSPLATVQSMDPNLPDRIEFQGFEVLKAFHGIDSHLQRVSFPVVDNSQDMEKLRLEVDQLLDDISDPVGYFIRGHGLYTWGRSVAKAKQQVEAIEFLLKCRQLSRYGNWL